MRQERNWKQKSGQGTGGNVDDRQTVSVSRLWEPVVVGPSSRSPSLAMGLSSSAHPPDWPQPAGPRVVSTPRTARASSQASLGSRAERLPREADPCREPAKHDEQLFALHPL